MVAVNVELMLLYWDIGRAILACQKREGWGAKVVQRMAEDLAAEFPGMKGLSLRNLKYMRAFADAWPNREFVQQVVAQIPWRTNIKLLDKINDKECRIWYAKQAISQRISLIKRL